MKKILLFLCQSSFFIALGGMIYYNFEILYRGHSHISMILCGGLSFYSICLLGQLTKYKLNFFVHMFLGALIITSYEFITGYIVNIFLRLHVWDYSNFPFNYKGQICLRFSLLWILMSGLCVLSGHLLHLLFPNRL